MLLADTNNKTTQVEVPWARPGSGFRLLFEALALSLCQSLPVAQAADQLRVASKRLWRRIEHYVGIARESDEMKGVRVVGIDETSIKKGHNYIGWENRWENPNLRAFQSPFFTSRPEAISLSIVRLAVPVQ